MRDRFTEKLGWIHQRTLNSCEYLSHHSREIRINKEPVEFTRFKEFISENIENANLDEEWNREQIIIWLFQIVFMSRTDESKSKAASDAITLLNFMNVSFSGMDLSNIEIPNANLSNSIIDSANFTGANLNGVNFMNSMLGDCTFDETSMNDVKFGVPHGKLEGHTRYVNSVCNIQGPNGEKWLVSGSDDKTICIWDIATGNQIKILEGHTEPVRCVLSIHGPNGENWLASGSWDNTIRIWDIDTGNQIKILEGHSYWISSVCSIQGPNGENWLASGSWDKTIRIWDIATGTQIQNLQESEVTYTHGKYLVEKENPDKSIAIFNKSSDAMNLIDTNTISDGKTVQIIDPRKLQGGNIRLRNVKGLNQFNKRLLFSIGAFSFDENFVKYCDEGKYTKFQAQMMAECYENGWIVEKNIQKSYVWTGKAENFEKLKQLAQEGSKDAFNILVEFAELKENENYKYPQAVSAIGECYENGWNVEKSVERAIEFYKKSENIEKLNQLAQEGSADAFNILLEFSDIMDDFMDENGEVVSEIYKYPQAVSAIGECYENGWFVEKSVERAIEFYKKSENIEKLNQLAQEGSKDAFNVLLEFSEMKENEIYKYPHVISIVAECYENGWGVGIEQMIEWFGPKSMNKDECAYERIKTYAEQGYAHAQSIMGYCTRNEINTTKDIRAAFEWYKKAAEQNHPEAYLGLGNRYFYGEGLNQDYNQAFKYYMKALQLGNEESAETIQKFFNEFVTQGLTEDELIYLHGICCKTENSNTFLLEKAKEGSASVVRILTSFHEKFAHIVAPVVAECYENGWGVEVNAEIAVEWRKKFVQYEDEVEVEVEVEDEDEDEDGS